MSFNFKKVRSILYTSAIPDCFDYDLCYLTTFTRTEGFKLKIYCICVIMKFYIGSNSRFYCNLPVYITTKSRNDALTLKKETPVNLYV